ncbi:MAG TPA: hypothetical protein VK524_00105 [Polyangiaceae bacterium]|nr:hypothetical protein [Polyangiaceae bacterium]
MKPITRKQAARKMRTIAAKADRLWNELVELRHQMREAGMCDAWQGAVSMVSDKVFGARRLDLLAHEVGRFESREDCDAHGRAHQWFELAQREGRFSDGAQVLHRMAEQGCKHAARYLAELAEERRTA